MDSFKKRIEHEDIYRFRYYYVFKQTENYILSLDNRYKKGKQLKTKYTIELLSMGYLFTFKARRKSIYLIISKNGRRKEFSLNKSFKEVKELIDSFIEDNKYNIFKIKNTKTSTNGASQAKSSSSLSEYLSQLSTKQTKKETDGSLSKYLSQLSRKTRTQQREVDLKTYAVKQKDGPLLMLIRYKGEIDSYYEIKQYITSKYKRARYNEGNSSIITFFVSKNSYPKISISASKSASKKSIHVSIYKYMGGFVRKYKLNLNQKNINRIKEHIDSLYLLESFSFAKPVIGSPKKAKKRAAINRVREKEYEKSVDELPDDIFDIEG